MNISKNVSVYFNVVHAGEDILFGIQNLNAVCDCCTEKVNVTEIGFGIAKITLAITHH